MEKQEEKKRKVYQRRRRQSKSTSSFPLDLISEILLRMPEKSVVRFRCVSKLSSSITTDPYFIRSFENRSPRPSLLLCFRKDDNLFVCSIPQHTHSLHKNSNKSYSSSQTIDRYQIKYPVESSYLSPRESVHGLICFEESATLVVWNPSMRRFFTLPKPRKSWNELKVLLGYDPIGGKHKVVCLPHKRSCHAFRVLTLGSAKELWRSVKTKHKHRSSYYTSGRCINGVVYYIAYIFQKRAWVMMSFDVRYEKFHMMQLPTGVHSGGMLITYKGRLACVDRIHTKNGCTLWILEDAETHKWSSQDFLAPFCHYDERLNTGFFLKGFTHAGEFIYAPHQFHKSFYILFYDPVRNCWRRFEFKGITDDESGLDDGVGNGIYQLHAFPNHIESQMSL